MAFKDIETVLYGGKIKINYLDKAHRYYRQARVNWDLPVDDPKAWGKKKQTKGVTTLLDGTLEKKGLMTWPLGLALGELFGFYNFTNEKKEKMIGFSRDKGTLWKDGALEPLTQDDALPFIKSASEAWSRKQKKGADIGNVVHDAIEHFVKEAEFDIALEYMNSIKEADYEDEAARDRAFKEFDEDVRQATDAFNQFVKWWNDKKPVLIGAEDLVYSIGTLHEDNDEICTSKDENGECHCDEYSGTYDGLIQLDGKIVLCDWKTSNASLSKAAAAPQGVYYSYFIQSAAYAAAWQEMGNDLVDDLLIVSARKDGGFDTKLLSEVGLTVQQAVDWWKAVKVAYRCMTIVKNKLVEQGGL